VDLAGSEDWICAHVTPVGVIETTHARPWSTVLRVPVAGGVVWFKACAVSQAFEPRLTTELFARWPAVMPEVLGHDEDRAWLLLADAGPSLDARNPPEAWLAAVPLYAELQRGEIAHVNEHLAHGVPDLRVAELPRRYEELLRRELPLEPDEVDRLRRFAPRLDVLCGELGAHDVRESVQHDDLHMNNLFVDSGTPRILDWGDASISHPFASLVVTFRFLEERTNLDLDDPWFTRIRDAYLEPWGRDLVPTFDLAMQVGAFAHAIAWLRQRDHLPHDALADFDEGFATILRRALRHVPV